VIDVRAYLLFGMRRNELETLTEDRMKSLAIHAAVLTGFGALMPLAAAGTVVATVPMNMIDEGNGRYTPCEALVKQMMKKKKG
jgi:hypothetical protein